MKVTYLTFSLKSSKACTKVSELILKHAGGNARVAVNFEGVHCIAWIPEWAIDIVRGELNASSLVMPGSINFSTQVFTVGISQKYQKGDEVVWFWDRYADDAPVLTVTHISFNKDKTDYHYTLHYGDQWYYGWTHELMPVAEHGSIKSYSIIAW